MSKKKYTQYNLQELEILKSFEEKAMPIIKTGYGQINRNSPIFRKIEDIHTAHHGKMKICGMPCIQDMLKKLYYNIEPVKKQDKPKRGRPRK